MRHTANDTNAPSMLPLFVWELLREGLERGCCTLSAPAPERETPCLATEARFRLATRFNVLPHDNFAMPQRLGLGVRRWSAATLQSLGWTVSPEGDATFREGLFLPYVAVRDEVEGSSRRGWDRTRSRVELARPPSGLTSDRAVVEHLARRLRDDPDLSYQIGFTETWEKILVAQMAATGQTRASVEASLECMAPSKACIPTLKAKIDTLEDTLTRLSKTCP